jgi:hypothetical protein
VPRPVRRPRRRRWTIPVALAAFVVVAGALGVAAVMATQREARRDHAIDLVRRTAELNRAIAEAELATPGLIDRSEAVSDAWASLARTLPGPERAKAEALAMALARRAEIQAAYELELETVETDVLDFGAFASAGQVADAIDAVASMRGATGSLDAAYRALDAELRSFLVARGVYEGDATEFLAACAPWSDRYGFDEATRLEMDVMDAAADLLRLLHDRWGGWEIRGGDAGPLLFYRPEDQARADEAWSRLGALIEQRLALPARGNDYERALLVAVHDHLGL